MARYLVEYTHKRGSHYNAHERIQGIAGDQDGGWYHTENQVIAAIASGRNSYYVSKNGKQVAVVTADHLGRTYIKTENDGYSPDNLLELDEPPARLLP